MTTALLGCAAALFSISSTQAAATFLESGGSVLIEAEHFDSRTKAADNIHAYTVAPDEFSADDLAAAVGQYKNARGGRYVAVLPVGENRNAADLQAAGPSIDYKVQISTTGDYQLFLRAIGFDGASDSCYVSIPELKKAAGGPGPDWYRLAMNPDTGDFSAVQNLPFDATTVAGWTGNGTPEVNNGGDLSDDVPLVWTIAKAGTYTIRVQQRESGNGLDALILQRNNKPTPASPGPAESALAAGFLIGAQPVSQTTTPGGTATFSVSALAPSGAVVTYKWQSAAPGTTNYTDIAGATSASYVTPTATVAMNGTKFRAVLASGGTSLTSAAATLITDATPPALLSVVGGHGGSDLSLIFSEKLDKASAETATNYTIAGLAVTGAKLAADGVTVVLTTAKQTAETTYTVSANGIKDLAGNAMKVAGTGSFNGPTVVAGKVLVRFYRNIGGTAVAALSGSPRYPNAPDDAVLWDVVSTGDGTGDTFGENYGLEVTGFFTPAATGNHKFYIRSDDASALYLSTDSSEAGLRLIAQQTGCCNSFTDTPGTLSSQPIALTKGQPYFFRAFLKEGGGGDYLGVGVLGPSDPDINDAASVVPIGAAFLSTGFSKTTLLSISQQPANTTVGANSAATFSLGVSASSVLGTNATVQWQRAAAGTTAFADIPGATNGSYTLQFPKASDNGAQFRAVVTAGPADPALGAIKTVTSQAGALTVSGDTVPPTVTNVGGGVSQIVVYFSEPLDAASATNASNYKISGNVAVSSAKVISAANEAGVVALSTTGIIPGGTYSVTITGVKDTAGNAVAATTKNFEAFHILSNFNDGGVPPGAAISGSANVKPSGGPDGSGFLELTTNAGSLQGSIVYDDVLGGAEVTKFTAMFKLFIGKGSGNAADGFSFSMGSSLAPNFGEEGTGSDLIVSFDTYDNGGGEAPAISVKFAGNEFAKTNVTKATLVNNLWSDVIIRVYANGAIDVYHNNIKYFDKLPIEGWAPIAGAQIGLGARTGGENEAAWVDDLKVVLNADVAVNEAPAIAITYPANGAILPVGTNVTITVNATDKENQIAKVEFYANGAKLGESTTAPYSFTVPNVPKGAYLITAKVTDVPGISITSSQIKVVVGNPDKVLLVTTDPGPLTFPGDQAVYEHLTARGYDVKIARGSDVPDDGSTANGTVMVFQSSSLGSGTVVAAAGGSKFKNLTIPVMEWEASNEDDFSFQAANGTTTGADQTQINIVDATSQVAAGFPTGLVTVVTSPQVFSQGTPTGASIVARNAADPTQAVLYTYDKGQKGEGGFAMPGRRIFFFIQDNTATALNAAGWKIFDAATDWGLGIGGTAPARLTATRSGTTVSISWDQSGTLQSAAKITGPWTDETGTSPKTFQATGAAKFFRVR